MCRVISHDVSVQEELHVHGTTFRLQALCVKKVWMRHLLRPQVVDIIPAAAAAAAGESLPLAAPVVQGYPCST
jgi:hypothetical protein